MSKRYVWRDGEFRDRKTGEVMPIPERKGVCAPMAIIADIEPYQSIVNSAVDEHGRVSLPVVSGRAGRREEIAAARDRGLEPWEPVTSRPRGLINKEFAGKRGLKTSEAASEWAAAKLKKQRDSAAQMNPFGS